MVRVLYFHQHFSTPAGATGIRSYEMARRMVARGHEVTMVCGSYGVGSSGLAGVFCRGVRQGLVDGISVIEFDLQYSNADSFLKRTGTFLSFAFRSVALALTLQYDILFATTTPLTAGIPGIFARWFRRKPFVFEVRDLWPELPRAMGVIQNRFVLAAMSFLEWASYKSAHRLIGLSPGIVDGIARLGIQRNRIVMIPNGCDLDLFAEPVAPWRPKGVKPADLMAVFAGSHGVANGLAVVLEVGAELKRRKRDDVKLVLIGDGKLKPQLAEQARKSGLDNIIFHPPVNKSKLAGLMKATDVGMQILDNVPAFYYGTSPNKFFDYIAAGVPVLNNYPGWLADLIVEANCGFAVPPDSPPAFADALEYAADHREELKAMGRRSLSLARERFDRLKLADHFVDWLVGS